MDENKLIKIQNRSGGNVGYKIPEMNIRRQFTRQGEVKQVPFKELRALSWLPGGDVLLKQFLMIQDKEAIAALLNEDMEPEYFYSEDDIKNIMQKGSLDAFKDMVDFSFEGGRDIIKKLAVELPLNDVEKRDYIKEKMSFDVTKAILINKESATSDGPKETAKRRVAIEDPAKEEKPEAPARRTAAPDYKIIK